MGRCVPCNSFNRPVLPPMRGPPIGFYSPPRPVIVRPVYPVAPMVPMRSIRPVAPIVAPPPILNTPRAPFAGPIGVPPPSGPMMPGAMMSGPAPFGPGPMNQGISPGCAPGFRFVNNQCIRSGANAFKPLNAINIGIMILVLSFFN